MEINDFHDTVELDNVTRQFLNRLKASMEVFDTDELDDITVLRFAVIALFGISSLPPLSKEVTEAMGCALTLAKSDPVMVEQDLFR